MADLRIYLLTDIQSSYDPDIYLAVSESTFTNDKKMKIGTIYPKTNTLSAAGNFNPASTMLRVDNDSGDESKLSITNMLGDSDVQDIILAYKRTAVLACTRVAHLDAGNFDVNAIQVGDIVCVSGQIEITSTPGSDVIFTLPAGVEVPVMDWYAACVDAAGSGSESIELKLLSGTRNVIAIDSSEDKLSSFSFTYVV